MRRQLPPRLGAELRREGHLRAQTEQLRFLEGLLEAIPNPIFFKDTRFTYRWCNHAMEKVLGLPRHELIGRSVLDVQPKSTAEINLHADIATLSEGRNNFV